jgi:hypothetical protein
MCILDQYYSRNLWTFGQVLPTSLAQRHAPHVTTRSQRNSNPHARLALEHVGGKGISCETCHDPGKAHVDGSGDNTKIFNPAKATSNVPTELVLAGKSLGTDKRCMILQWSMDEGSLKPIFPEQGVSPSSTLAHRIYAVRCDRSAYRTIPIIGVDFAEGKGVDVVQPGSCRAMCSWNGQGIQDSTLKGLEQDVRPRQAAQSLPNSTSLRRPCGCSLPSVTAPSGSPCIGREFDLTYPSGQRHG